MSPDFAVSFPGLSRAEDVLGLWSASPDELAFHAPRIASLQAQAGAVWRADLPEDPLEAQRLLSSRAAQLRLSQRSLEQAGSLLRSDLRSLPASGDGESFAALAGWSPASPDTPRGLLELAYVERFSIQASFAGEAQERLDEGLLDQAAQIAGDFFAQVQRLVGQFALVESSLGGRRLGLTRVGWTGDTQTWWSARAGREDYPLHQQVLAQSLGTRQAWLSFALLFSAGVVQVAAALASGPFSLLAIWTTWNYLKKVIEKYRALHTQPLPQGT